MLWIILVFIAVSLIWISIRSMARKREEKRLLTEFASRVRSRPEVIDTGEVTKSEDNGWILNPKSTFPITVYGVDEDVAKRIKEMLDRGLSDDIYRVAENISSLVARYKIRCKEVDEYIKTFKPIYLRKIEEQIKEYPNWEELSDEERKELISKFRSNAILSLEVRPYCDIEVLFGGDALASPIYDALIEKYGYDAIKYYLRRKNRGDIVSNENEFSSFIEEIKDLDLFYEEMSLYWQYIEEVSFLIAHTYMMSAYATRDYRDFKKFRRSELTEKWKLINANDENVCPYCRSLKDKNFSFEDYPKVPLHIGCRCVVTSVIREKQ
ncbi:MAG: hypothetical protein N2380_00925 [bacterium]|nr:hypothetical protein [bacterium]